MGCLRITLLLGVCLVAFGVSPLVPPAAAGAPPCFAATGACIDGVFAAYWQAHGGLAVNGYPLGPAGLERLEDTRAYLVQYFERVRLEYHPENAPPYDILLGQFGRQMHPADPAVAPRADAAFFPETGHNVRAGFRDYWEANGGLAQFGLPLTEEFAETLENGQSYTVQYFERARFEYHPENASPDDVLLGQFGRARFAASFLAPAPGQPPGCRLADLAYTAGYSVGHADIGGGVTLTNRGAVPCAVAGTPTLTPADDAGTPAGLPFIQRDLPARCSGGPTDPTSGLRDPRPCPAQWAITVPPGGHVVTFWTLDNYCAPPTAPPLAFAVTLPDGEQFVAPVADADGHRAGATLCTAPAEPARLDVEPFAYDAGTEPAFTGVAGFYTAINQRDYRGAYAVLDPALQAQQPYALFADGFATTARVTLAVETIIPAGPEQWTTEVRIAAQQTDGTVRSFRGSYTVRRVPVGGDAPSALTKALIVTADVRPSSP